MSLNLEASISLPVKYQFKSPEISSNFTGLMDD